MTTQHPYSAPPFDPKLGTNLAALGALVNPTLRPEGIVGTRDAAFELVPRIRDLLAGRPTSAGSRALGMPPRR